MTGMGLGITSGVNSMKLLQSEEVITGVGKVVAQEGKALHNVPRVASDIPDIGQAAVKGPLALSQPGKVLLHSMLSSSAWTSSSSVKTASVWPKAARLKSHSSSEPELHFGKRSMTPCVRAC
ncbi:uncharacterized protein AKAME5_002438300 [Lates japonicus]|uniref:Uncharacterized protein n=1 Tax=Lates japonicus TaxID=270547 RepID=A0AAD3NIB5_LATJO|nr:uncharacterized protein AKAME5_002438300 [Lates japonicus]